MSTTNNIPGPGSHFISLEDAADMTALFRTEKENILSTSAKGQNILPNSETFNRSDIDTLLAKDGCAALRIYYGMKESLTVHAIIVPVNEDNEDILSDASPSESTDNGIVEEAQRCPDLCPPSSALNE